MTDSAVVLVRGRTVPDSAVPLLRTAARVEVVGGVDPALAAPGPADGSVVLLTDDLTHPAAAALLAEGVPLHAAPGTGLVAAAEVMDRLRSPGGCPWDAEQSHESLRQYLVEECYELLEAIDDGDRAALREELGDVLLQVLFHARVAEEHPTDPFTVDDVAADLVAKLVGRHPHVFGDGDPAVRDARTQEHRWEELKQREKRRASCVDGVALGQPALALAAKLVQRTARAGLPADLLPSGGTPGARLFDTAALARLAGQDPEGELRAVARAFAADVRAAETAARAAGVDTLTEDDWRAYWPR
ncbi:MULTISPECIES: MazG family protein [Actinokineospora]|uniref:Nucleoside triphosphate pyrophosphohydrolase n=1 Tax=Actinokineospora fastidiosa TaxID=1816 RepID=A0A918G1M8_9PSEU|nr:MULTISPECIES: MazG family protein [Actinokineospora]UVS76975.1 Nucleoside triphosphate pyrophosphohydrolase [Actinokineospora sp. UTMC 2448]GGS14416.1 nucleoside triphosphate pyrophosphohydrolase [Actinokineospora fastidiosa]